MLASFCRDTHKIETHAARVQLVLRVGSARHRGNNSWNDVQRGLESLEDTSLRRVDEGSSSTILCRSSVTFVGFGPNSLLGRHMCHLAVRMLAIRGLWHSERRRLRYDGQ